MVAERIERILARKKCKPTIVNNTGESLTENRRKFFRIKLPLSLEAVLEVLEVKGNQVNIGKTKVLIKDIGPGGLCIFQMNPIHIIPVFKFIVVYRLLNPDY
jgi:hypothetical protein